MRVWQALSSFLCFYWLLRLQLASCAAPLGSSSASGPAESEGICGDRDTRVTLCFPGSPQQATCIFNVITNYSINDVQPSSSEVEPCKQEFLFGFPCEQFPGTLYIAYGPCNSDDTVLPPNATDSLSVTKWLDVLGINSIKMLGGLFARGYAYQEKHDVSNVTFLPDLEELIPPQLVEIDNVNYFQVTVSGMPMPPIPNVRRIPAGLSILNSPDVDFTKPPRFTMLSEVSLGLSIAGCNRLRTLDGLENLLGGSSVTNVEMINNLVMSNISALSDFFRCQKNGSTLLEPDLLVGTFGMHPIGLQAQNKGCTLNTPRQVCAYIAASDRCPPNTEYIRFRDGTIKRIPSDLPLSPASSIAPEPSPYRDPGLPPGLPPNANLSFVG